MITPWFPGDRRRPGGSSTRPRLEPHPADDEGVRSDTRGGRAPRIKCAPQKIGNKNQLEIKII
jgi:hypothetical protein